MATRKASADKNVGQNNRKAADGSTKPVEEGVGSKSATGFGTEQNRQANADGNTEQRADAKTGLVGEVKNVEGVNRDEIGQIPIEDALKGRPAHTSGTKDASVNPGDPGSGTGADSPAANEREGRVPEVRGTTQAQSSDRVVKIGDRVMVRTPNPVNAMLENPGTVVHLNQDGTINVEISSDSGGVIAVSDVKNAPQQDNSPFWTWPAEGN